MGAIDNLIPELGRRALPAEHGLPKSEEHNLLRINKMSLASTKQVSLNMSFLSPPPILVSQSKRETIAAQQVLDVKMRGGHEKHI